MTTIDKSPANRTDYEFKITDCKLRYKTSMRKAIEIKKQSPLLIMVLVTVIVNTMHLYQISDIITIVFIKIEN